MEASGQTGSERSRGVSCSASVAEELKRVACRGQRMQRVAGQCESELVADGGVERQDKLYMGGGQPCKYPATAPRDHGRLKRAGMLFDSLRSPPMRSSLSSLSTRSPYHRVPTFHALLRRSSSGIHDV